MIGAVVDWLAAALLVCGGLFGLIGSFGLLRLQSAMQRLHAPSIGATVGLGAVLLACAILGGTAREVLIALFIFLTAPVTTIFLAKAVRHADGQATDPARDRKDMPPQ